MGKLRRWVFLAVASAVAIGCFGTTVTDLAGYPEWGDDNSSARGIIRVDNVPFVLSRSYNRLAMARFHANDGTLKPGTAPGNDWGYGLGDEGSPEYDPQDGPLGWVAWSPPSGGSSHTPTGFAYDATGQYFYVTGSAATAGGIAAAFSAIDKSDGSVALNTWFFIGSFYNDITGGFAPGEDIFVSGSDAYVFGVVPRPSLNALLWVGNLDLQGAVDHSFGDACMGNPPPCMGKTGFITLDAGFAGLEYGDALIDSGTGYVVATGDGGAIVIGTFGVATGSGASVWTTDGTASDTYDPEAIALQSDGKVLVAGQDADDAFIIRYDTNGSRDTTFGTNGQVTFNVPGNAEAKFNDMRLLQNDVVLVAGYTKANQAGAREALSARFLSDGTLDTAYSPTGYQITTVSGVDDTSFDSISNGNPAAAGVADGDILLTRLVPQAP